MHIFIFIYQFPKSNVLSFEFKMRDTLKDSTSCFLIRLSPLVLVPIGLFHRTQRPLIYAFIGLKVLTFVLQILQYLLPLHFQRLSRSFVLQRLQCLMPLHFKDYHILLSCRDNQGHLLLYFSKTIRVFCLVETINVIRLYFSKTIRVFCLVETIKVIYHLLFKDYQSLLSCEDYQCHPPLLFKDYHSLLSCRDNQGHLFIFFEDFNVFCQDYHSLLYILKTSMSFVKTTMFSLTFQRLQCLQSFTLSKDENVFIYLSKDFNVFSHLFFQKTTTSS